LSSLERLSEYSQNLESLRLGFDIVIIFYIFALLRLIDYVEILRMKVVLVARTLFLEIKRLRFNVTMFIFAFLLTLDKELCGKLRRGFFDGYLS
jgi:hypothetical protein